MKRVFMLVFYTFKWTKKLLLITVPKQINIEIKVSKYDFQKGQ